MLKLRKNKGITLVALVITIIILLILAGIAIGTLTNSGLFNKTQVAKETYTFEDTQEQLELDIMNLKMQKYVDGGSFPTLNELKTYLEDSKFEGEYLVEISYEPLAAEETQVVAYYAKVTHVPTKFVFYVDGKMVVVGGENPGTVAKNDDAILDGGRGNFNQTVSTLLAETSCTLSSQDSWTSSTPRETHTLADDIDNYDSIAIIMKHRPTSHTETNAMVRYVNPKVESGLITTFGASSDNAVEYYNNILYSLKDSSFNIYRRWYSNFADLSFTIYGIKYNCD